MRFSYDLVAIGDEVAAQIVVALRRIIVDERAALDGDGAGVVVFLVQNVIEITVSIVGVEETALDGDVASGRVDDSITVSIGIAAYGESATLDGNIAPL